ncbi:MAG: hypothetical protein ACHQF2_11015 [Flavobacteriales bacterium]
MRLAIIDIGTNTFNLLIAERKSTKFSFLHEEKIPVKLGEGGMLEQKIQPEAFQRGIEAMILFSQFARSYQCEKIIAYATAAVRSALNGNEFKEAVFKKTNIEIQIINGEKEAAFIATGARHAVAWEDQALIMDIGGGSTEFIIADKTSNQYVISTSLGVSRLKEMFSLPDPAETENVLSLREYIRSQLAPVEGEVKQHNVTSLVGCAGSFDSLATIICMKKEGRPFDFKKNSSFTFPVGNLNLLLEELIVSTAYQRAVMPGLPVFRQPFMVYAAVLIQETIERFGIKSVYLSTYSLKEGALYESSYE